MSAIQSVANQISTQMQRTISSTPTSTTSSTNSNPIHHYQVPDQQNKTNNSITSIVNQNREIVTDKASLIASLNCESREIYAII